MLIEGPPGTGKTLTAKLLARILSRSFKRVQFTSDLLPGDILGSHIFDPEKREFKFIPGPIFTDFLLADEINRTPPRTQSALLEAMEEAQVTIDGQEFHLSPEFFALATQNPQDYEGTFPLPEVQLDRFLFKLVLRHAPAETEIKILQSVIDGLLPPRFPDIHPIGFDRNRLDLEVKQVKVDPSLLRFVTTLLEKTRTHPMLISGSSIRGGIALIRASRIRALSLGRYYITPDDLKFLAVPTLRHRVRLSPEAQISQMAEDGIILHLLKETPFPE